MYKQHLLNNIEKEICICRRLYTKIPPGQMDFRPKEGLRSIVELLRYLSIVGSAMPAYWLKKDDTDFNTFFTSIDTASRTMKAERFPSAMNEQMAAIRDLFDQISEDDLQHKVVDYPWGGKAPMGEAIMATSIKFLTGYKLQLFSLIKLCDNQKLTTADAWFISDLSS
ncbi:MAG: hypothetical protein ACT4OJ_13640 [Bacteroidota bacterium]